MDAKSVQEFFESVATDWDTMRLAYYDESVFEKMAEVSKVGRDSEVVDVGTGTGFSQPDSPRESSGLSE
jgi:ubiquinone/menaquinone biosynthesis C-methylase UbiE